MLLILTFYFLHKLFLETNNLHFCKAFRSLDSCLTLPLHYHMKQRHEPLFQQAALDTITLEHGSIVTLEIFLKHLYVSTLTHL